MIAPAQTQIDIQRTASRLLRTYGAEAVIVANKWANTAKLAGDPDRFNAWCGIVDLIRRSTHPQTIR